MIYSTQAFSLNLHDTDSGVYLRIKNGDTARKYYCTLIDGDIVYQMSSDCYAKLTGKTPGGDIVLANCRILDNKVVFNLTPSISRSIGETECEIRVYSAQNEEILTSPRFTLLSEPALYNEVSPDPPVYAASIITLNLPSYAWTGSGGIWAQQAMIDNGITSHSKVDLQPSAAQLALFHQSDLTLTTKNENGTVSVIAIGDKPVDDMTIQATVTEVQ